MNNVNNAIELDAAPIKVRQAQDRRAALTQPAIPAYLVEYVTEVGEIKSGELVTANSPEPSWILIDKCFQIDAVARVIAGFELHKFKNSLEHGEFVAALAERGISHDKAKRCMRVATMFSQLNISKRAARPLLNLDFMKLLKIQQWETEEVSAFCEGESVRGLTLAEAHDMSVRDFEKQINEADALAYRLRKEIAEKDKIIQHKDEQLAKANTLFAHTGQPPIVADMRVRSTAITGQIHILLDMLADMEVTLAKGYESGLAFEKEERTQQLRAALMPWTINLNATQARIAQIINRAQDHFDTALFPGKDDLVQLSEAECLAVKTQHAFMTDLMDKVGQRQQGKSTANNKKKGKKK
ncbi:MAG: hypothetical protein ACXWT1_05765 [Methylobacter sp.]